MAEIVLHPRELEQGGLPTICVVCGAAHATPAPVKLNVTVAENYFVRTLRVQDAWLPVCESHRWHFSRRQIHIIAGAICMAMFLPCMGLTALVAAPFVRDLPFGWVCAIIGLVVPFVVGAVIMYLGKHGNVEAGDITETGSLVVNVSDLFVTAVESARKERGETK